MKLDTNIIKINPFFCCVLIVLLSALLGFLSWILYQYFYLIVIFDIAIGLAIGKSIVEIFKKNDHTINKNIFLLCIVCSLTVFLSYNVIDFYSYKKQIYAELTPSGNNNELARYIYEYYDFPNNTASYILYRAENESIVVQDFNFSSIKDSIKTTINLSNGDYNEIDASMALNISLWTIQFIIVTFTSFLICRRFTLNNHIAFTYKNTYTYRHSPLVLVVPFIIVMILIINIYAFIADNSPIIMYFAIPLYLLLIYLLWKYIYYIYRAYSRCIPMLTINKEYIEYKFTNVLLKWKDIQCINFDMSNWGGIIKILYTDKNKNTKKINIPIWVIDESKQNLLIHLEDLAVNNSYNPVELLVD